MKLGLRFQRRKKTIIVCNACDSLLVNIYLMRCNKERSDRGQSFNFLMFIIELADR
jgi:hypothetical protein